MCGIFAFSNITEVTKKMAPILALEMESRGDDSWGCTDGEHYYKSPKSILEDWANFPGWATWQSAIFHTRGASVGKVSEENAHPFWGVNSKDHLVIGVHNGHVSNWKEMNTKYNRTCEVDSEHIFLHLAAGLDLKELGSSGAIAWFDNKVLKFAKTISGSLECARLDSGEVVICSTMSAIRKAASLAGAKIAGFVKEIKPAFEHSLVLDGDKLKIQEGNDIHFIYGGTYEHKGHRNGPVRDWRQERSTPTYHYHQCSVCFKAVGKLDDVVCQTCLDDAEVSVKGWEAQNRMKQMPRYLGMTIQ